MLLWNQRAQLFLCSFAGLCWGCWGGVNTVRVSTIPDRAALHVNGTYVGETPKSVPHHWNRNIFGALWGDSLQIVILKPGYRRVEKTITIAELDRRFWAGDHGDWDSEFGWGCTFPYTFELESERGPQ